MVIFGNNLHEKLQGLAISRDYLKYNTPFCDLVDAPEWQTDINLALDFNSAINGNEDAATKVVQSLTLNSSILDPSTVEFYLHKIKHNPIFFSAIKDMRTRWDNLDGFDDEFQFDLKKALEDCLNSPCNLFQETSDSIGRMAQTASTRTSDNSMGSLEFSEGSTAGQGDDVDNNPKTSISNMIDGMDQTITNKIPSVFKDAFTEVVGLANKAFENTQDALAGKKNLDDFRSKVQEGKSFRSPAKVFRYSPDVKSHYDYSAASSNVLAKIKEDIGGCFNRFEFKYRYNPYENNMSRPIGEKVNHINGKDFDSDATGTVDRKPSNSNRLDKQTTTSKAGDNLRSDTVTLGKGISTDKVKVSKSYILEGKTSTNRQNYSVFSSLIDEKTNTLWYESYSATPDDKLTLQGVANVGQNYRIGTSTFGRDSDFIKRALNIEETSLQEKQKYGTTTQPGNYAAHFKHQLDDQGMETLFNTPETNIINDGVAISKELFREFVNDPSIGVGSASYKKPQVANEFFVAARPAKASKGRSNKFKYYKVIDSNQQDKLNVDFTVGAWSHFLESFGYGELTAASTGAARREAIDGTSWTKVQKIFTEKIGGPMEIKICTGPLEDIKSEIENVEPVKGDEYDTAIAQLDEAFESPVEAANVVYELGGKTRNQPIQPKLAKILEKASADSGYKIVVFSGGQDIKGQGTRRTGSTRHDRGYAADIRVYDDGTRLSSENTAHHVRLAMFAKRLKMLGMESFGSGPGYMGGNHHVDIAISAGQGSAPVWGAGGRSANTPSWLKRSFV